MHKEFRTFVYSFTWVGRRSIIPALHLLTKQKEDPSEDVKYLKLTSYDSVFVITSAGDNALHYAIAAKPKHVRDPLSTLRYLQ